MARKAKGSRPSAVDPSPPSTTPAEKPGSFKQLRDEQRREILLDALDLAGQLIHFDEENGGSEEEEMIVPPDVWAAWIELAGQIAIAEVKPKEIRTAMCICGTAFNLDKFLVCPSCGEAVNRG